MYQFSYSEVMAESPADARSQERMALDHAVSLLAAAAAGRAGGAEEQAALVFVTQLWGVFIKDLASPGNDLPADLRARLMSTGLWIMSEAQRIQMGQSRNLEGIAAICRIVHDGLEG